MKTQDANEETRLAQEIVSVLPAGSVMRFCSEDLESIRFAVESTGLKLRRIVLKRASLRRLLGDVARAVKVEYLQRDLLRSAARRAEFRYPRLDHPLRAARGARRRGLAAELAYVLTAAAR